MKKPELLNDILEETEELTEKDERRTSNVEELKKKRNNR